MSEANHVETFPCPHCGAPIPYDGKGERTVLCPFCGQSAMVPEHLLPRAVAPQGAGMDLGGEAQALRLIVQALQNGNKIEAIKVYRQYTGAPLLAAKTAVEQIEQGQPVSFAADESHAQPVAPATFGPAMFAPVGQAAPGKSVSPMAPILVIMVIIFGVAALIFFGAGAFNPSPVSPTIDVAAEQQSLKATILARFPTPEIPTIAAPAAPTQVPQYANPVLSFGKEGTGAGRFTNAARIGIDGKGNVYVGEYDGGRVQVFDPTGKFISQFVPADSSTKLESMAVSGDGVVYTSDDATITVYNGQTGHKTGSLSYAGGPGFGELAVAPDGGLAAMWYPHHNGAREGPEKLVLFDPQGKVTQVISAPISSQTGEYEYDNMPLFDGQGNLYVVSHVSSAIFAFAAQGKYLNRFGSAGQARDQIYLPNAAAIDSQGYIYVADSNGVAEYTDVGRFVRKFEVQNGARAMVFSSDDQLWVLQGATVTRFALGQ